MLPKPIEDALRKFSEAAYDARACTAYAQNEERHRYRQRADAARAALVAAIREALDAK
jgi:hypothetical protein